MCGESRIQKKNKKEEILDLGVGPGRWSRFFVRRGFRRVVGVDKSPEMVDFSKKFINSRKYRGLIGDMQRINFKKDSFEKVFSFRAFKYVDMPKLAIREIERVLKPGGTLLLEVSNKSLPLIMARYINQILRKIKPNLSFKSSWYFEKAYFYGKKEAENLAANTNLRILSIHPLFILPARPLPTGKGALTWFWIAIDKTLFFLLPKDWFTRSWILLISKPKTKEL